MTVQSAQSGAKTLQEQLLCPVFLEPLSEAVSLVPCAHKVQQAAAQRLFGTVNDGWQVQSRNPCPVCKVSVVGYMKDHSTRNIVEQLFALPEQELNTMLAIMKKNLAEESKAVAKDVPRDVPYPGKSARFIHANGTWDLYDSGASLCRSMNFASSTENSWLKEFFILGYRSGSVSISLSFPKGDKSVVEYFKNFDIILTDVDLKHGSYKSQNQDQLKIIFNIIAENNEIPASHFDKIREIVAKGTHSSV